MMIPEGILCSKSHEYLLEGENGIYTVGLTDYAVEQLGDIVFIELPEAGTEFAKGEVFANCRICESSIRNLYACWRKSC